MVSLIWNNSQLCVRVRLISCVFYSAGVRQDGEGGSDCPWNFQVSIQSSMRFKKREMNMQSFSEKAFTEADFFILWRKEMSIAPEIAHLSASKLWDRRGFQP